MELSNVIYSVVLLKQAPITSVLLENVATLFCCEAPEMFFGLREFTCHSISVRTTG